MHTAKEAGELWCPMVRIARSEPVEKALEPSEYHLVGGCNSDALGRGNGDPSRSHPMHRPLASCRCIANKCGMWRWAPVTHANDETPPPARGYCGLAGRPEVTT